MTHRRYWVYFLLFLFNIICYLDRINMSVAGRSVAQEFRAVQRSVLGPGESEMPHADANRHRVAA